MELPPRRGEHYVLDLYYVWMTKQPKEFDLTEDACGIRYVLKHIIDLLNRNPLTGAGIYCSSNYSITPLANDFLDLVLACLSILSEEFFFQYVLQDHNSQEQIKAHDKCTTTLKKLMNKSKRYSST